MRRIIRVYLENLTPEEAIGIYRPLGYKIIKLSQRYVGVPNVHLANRIRMLDHYLR